MEEYKEGDDNAPNKHKSLIFNRSKTMLSVPSSALKKLYLSPSMAQAASSKNKTLYSSPIATMVTASSSIKGTVSRLKSFFESSRSSSKHGPPKDMAPPPLPTPSPALNNTKMLIAYTPRVIRLRGTEDRVVVYYTSLHGIRRTFNDCQAVRMIFRGFRVYVDERDVSMDAEYRVELQRVLGEKKNVSLPQVFIRGEYFGGAEVIKQLHETGELAKLLDGVVRIKPGYVCDGCGGARFVPCGNCDGSRKVYDEDEDVTKRCFKCNENGLVRCSTCCS